MATFRNAALEVLKRAQGALSVEEITQRAQEMGLLSTSGRTPSASMGAALYVDVKRNPETPFVQAGPGQFMLKPGAANEPARQTSASGSDFAHQVEKHNQSIKDRMLSALKEMDPQAFEHLIGRLLERLGYEGVQITKYSGDGGIDVTATLTVGGVTSVRTAVQVKRFSQNVSGKVVRELRGGIGVQERGLIITTAGFTRDATAEAASADKVPISLVDGERLVDLLVQKRLGVVGKTMEVLDLDLENLLPGNAEEAGMAESKYQSVWPLPGGDYVQALTTMLEYIGAENPTLDSMVTWIPATFPSVESPKVAESYISMLRYTGLVVCEGSQLTLTEAGAEYLAAPATEFLLEQFGKRFSGIYELMGLLRERPGTLESVHQFLVDRINAKWATTTQTRYRLEWLRALGVVERDAQGVWSA